MAQKFIRTLFGLALLMGAATIICVSASAYEMSRHPGDDLAGFGHAESVRGLLADGKADVNGRDERGNTPLIEAARAGHDDAVRALLVARADAQAKNDEGRTALSLAALGGHDEVIRLLREAGASQ